MGNGLSSISRKDLKFIAQDIGCELAPFLKPEDIVNGLSAKKRRELFVLLVENLNRTIEEMDPAQRPRFLQSFVAELDPEIRKRLAEAASRMQATNLADDKA